MLYCFWGFLSLDLQIVVIVKVLKEKVHILPTIIYFFCSGDYEVSIKFNDEHIPDSPFTVPIASLSDDARRLTITSLQVRKDLNLPAELTEMKPFENYIYCGQIYF